MVVENLMYSNISNAFYYRLSQQYMKELHRRSRHGSFWILLALCTLFLLLRLTSFARSESHNMIYIRFKVVLFFAKHSPIFQLLIGILQYKVLFAVFFELNKILIKKSDQDAPTSIPFSLQKVESSWKLDLCPEHTNVVAFFF